MNQVRGERNNHASSCSPKMEKKKSLYIHPGFHLPIVTPLFPTISYAASILSKLFCVTFDTVALIITITQDL